MATKMNWMEDPGINEMIDSGEIRSFSDLDIVLNSTPKGEGIGTTYTRPCAFACGQAAAAGDIYCDDCRSSLR